MPINTVKLSDGSTGYRYGQAGKIYRNREGAVRQAQAIHASGWSEDKRKEQKHKCPKCGKEECECKKASLHKFITIYNACMNKAAKLH